MKLGVDRAAAVSCGCDASVHGTFERPEPATPFPKALAEADEASGGLVRAAWVAQEVSGRRKEVVVFHRPDGKGRIAIVGLGPRSAYSTDVARRAGAEAVRAFKGRKAARLAFDLPTFVAGRANAAAAASALSEGTVLGAYEFTRYRPPKDAPVEESVLCLGRLSPRAAAVRKAVDSARVISETVVWTRDLANLPADTATPSRLAEEAVALGKELHLKVTVFGETDLAKMHCGGLLGVGGGSSHPPRLVVLEYPGKGRSPPTVAVVGKGITFDSGGISIKPSLHLSDMKFDKCGAVAVLGILRAAALRKVAPRVIGVLACAENLPSGTAYRPGDVLTTYGGKTIEVLNTDAEGRVVLADALGYVVDRFSPNVVIDLATLTGACVVALGDDMAGLVCPDDALARSLLDASRSVGEPIWRLPLTDTHRELVQSEIADVRNTTEMPPAGALTAAAFLETFVGKGRRWAHLDIAGPSWTNGGTRRYHPAYHPVGATAFGVRLITRFLEQGGR